MVLHVRKVLQYCNSIYPKDYGGRVAIKTSRKWRGELAIAVAELRFHHGVLIGVVSQGNAGLGTFATPRYENPLQQQLVQHEISMVVKEEGPVVVGMREIRASKIA